MPQRRADQLRPLRFSRAVTTAAPGSVLVEMGATRVLCTASLEAGVPPWREASGLGWVTAEYSMLPGCTRPRKPRARAGHTDSRGTEIQRLIGRVLRAAVDFEALGANTICLDCDVVQADGGTRTAGINGAYVALAEAVQHGQRAGLVGPGCLRHAVAAVSVGIVDDRARLDLDYQLDVRAQVDMNVAMTDAGRYVEIQGAAEHGDFDADQLERMLTLARRGIRKILTAQAAYLNRKGR